MNPTEHHFQVAKTARYYTLGPDIEEAKHILIALHGYGQLPAFFLRRFADLADAGWTIIAPEGLHRFYTSSTSGRVGASWMTKEDRISDMQDYVRYLDALTEHLQLREKQPALLGFSQGVATAARWACMGQQSFSRFIFWAGVFPPDLNWDHDVEPLRQSPVDIALGGEDPFFDDALIDDTTHLLNEHRIAHQSHRFDGGHTIDSVLLQSLLRSN